MYPFQKGGGSLMRATTVDKLRSLGWDVVVVMPEYRGFKVIEEEGYIRIPPLSILRGTYLLQTPWSSRRLFGFVGL